MPDERRNTNAIDWIVKGWPIILAIVSLVGGWSTMNARVSALESRAESIEHRFEDAEKDRRMEGDSLRDALNDMRVNIVRVCDKIGAACHD